MIGSGVSRALPMGPEIRLLAGALKASRRRLDQPLKLTWAVTYGCQSGCLSCAIWQRTPEGELKLDEIRKLFERAPGFSWVDITGGEPFLRNDLEDIAATVIERCRDLVLLHLPTNGLDPDRTERGVRAMLGMRPRRLILTVSVDGPPGLNETLRGHPEAWTAAIETFARLRRLRRRGAFDVYLGVTLQPANIEQAADILPAARRTIPDLAQDELHWNVAQTSDHFYGKSEMPKMGADVASRLRVLSGDDRRSPLDRLRGMHPVKHLDRRYRAHVAEFLKTGKSPLACRALWSTAFLDPKGVLYPCITWDRPLGSIRDHDYDLPALWRTQGVASAAADVDAGDCPQCWTPCEAVPTLLANPVALLL
jgi:MoaA/NifB/PqqE/SkfB family radical SAM enzyme